MCGMDLNRHLQIWKPVCWNFWGEQYTRAAATLVVTWQRSSVLPAHALGTHWNFIKHSPLALMNVKEPRRKTEFNCSKQTNCCRAFSLLCFWTNKPNQATNHHDFSKCPINNFSSQLLFFLVQWHSGKRSQISSYIKTLSRWTRRDRQIGNFTYFFAPKILILSVAPVEITFSCCLVEDRGIHKPEQLSHSQPQTFAV